MKHENKNIDKLVQNKLYDYRISVPDDIWENISEQLNTGTSTSIFTYWRYIAAAVVILFAFSSGYFISFKKFQKQEVQNTHKEISHKDSARLSKGKAFKHTSQRASFALNLENHKPVPPKTERVQLAQLNKKENTKRIDPSKNVRKSDFIIFPMLQNENKIKLASLEMPKLIFKKKEQTTKKTYTPKELLAIQNKVFEKDVPQATKKHWFIGGQLAPTYSYREMKRNNSDLPSKYYNSVEKALLTYSGGVSVNFQVNKRLSFQSGFNYSQFGQSSSLLYAQSSPKAGSAYEVATSAGIIRPQPKSIGTISNQYKYVDQLGNIINQNAQLIQNFNYIEIPINSKLKLIDKKMDLSIIGGFSTNILLGNKVFFKQANKKSYIGETENLNTIRYSTNFGFGFGYQIAKNIQFNLEPIFKYSLVPINKNPEISNYPFTFGLNTGFLVKF